MQTEEEKPRRSLDSPTPSPRPSKILRSDDPTTNLHESMSQNPRIQRYLIAIEYIGTRFCGSQKQTNVRTVVGVLELSAMVCLLHCELEAVDLKCRNSLSVCGGKAAYIQLSPELTMAGALCTGCSIAVEKVVPLIAKSGDGKIIQAKEAFHKFVGQPVSIFCSSRTDAGVHALSNVCHVDVERISKRKPNEVLPPFEPGVVKRAVNSFLQKNEGDIMVIDARFVPADFHSRFNAQERTYFYRLLSGPEPLSKFEKDRAWHIPRDLDLVAMQEACSVLIGNHDFSSFRSAGCQANSPVKTLDELGVCEVASSPYFPSIMDRGVQAFGQMKRHRCFIVTAKARSFLYHQVRLLVGVLKAVGTGDLTVSDVKRLLDAKTVTAASPMAPACGLYLANVKYDLP